MPQGRIVLKAICQSRKLADLKTDGARLLYTWLLPNVDVNGCFSGDPEVIKGQIFTRLRKSVKIIQAYLNDLNDAGLILLYEANGDTYLCIPDFVEKQPHINPDREGKTTIPLPTPEQLKTSSRPTPPKVKESKSKIESKVKHLSHVFLSKSEYEKLIKRFGEPDTLKKIKDLDYGIAVHGYKYKHHYRVILKWAEDAAPPEKATTPTTPLQATPCVFGHKVADGGYLLNNQGKPLCICKDCRRALRKMGVTKWDRPIAELEKIVEKGKLRPPPVKKDPELAASDKKQREIAKLTQGLGNKLKA